jgi:hypothetical protein
VGERDPAQHRPWDDRLARRAPAGAGYGEYAGIVRQVLAAVDALPQPHIALLELVQRLQREYLDRR